jgi:hypothetical protein
VIAGVAGNPPRTGLSAAAATMVPPQHVLRADGMPDITP